MRKLSRLTRAVAFLEAASLASNYAQRAHNLHAARWLEDLADDLRDYAVREREAYDNHKCDHSWIDVRNEVVESGEMCLKCGAIRAGNRTSA
jgi:hypothetical protein